MKVLLLADLHSEEAVIDRLANVHGRYDLIVVAGDLEGEDYSRRLLETSKKIHWIPGNMDSKSSVERHERCIHGRELELPGGLKLVGFGFSNPTPFGTPGELGEGEIYSGLGRLPINEKTVLVTHVPPYGILDEVSPGVNAGSRGLRKIIEERKPRIVACGHVHQLEGKEKCEETTVVQIPHGGSLRGIVLEVDGGRIGIKMERI